MDRGTDGKARGKPLFAAGFMALAGALIATLLVRVAALAIFDIPPEFLPLAEPGPTIFFTAVSTLGAIGTWALMRRLVSGPDRAFRWLAWIVLLVSFVPDLWLLTDGAATAFPGATVPAVGTLMLMHVVAAAVIVRSLTGALFSRS